MSMFVLVQFADCANFHFAAVVAGSGYCCPVGSILNNIGECCPSGVDLDACGSCGTSGRVVDFLGRCCNGSLDASGICCPPPLNVDQFGVCGGLTNTGVVVVDVQPSGDYIAKL